MWCHAALFLGHLFFTSSFSAFIELDSLFCTRHYSAMMDPYSRINTRNICDLTYLLIIYLVSSSKLFDIYLWGDYLRVYCFSLVKRYPLLYVCIQCFLDAHHTWCTLLQVMIYPHLRSNLIPLIWLNRTIPVSLIKRFSSELNITLATSVSISLCNTNS